MTKGSTDTTPITVLAPGVGGNVSQGILKALARSTLSCRVIGADISALQMGLYTTDVGYISPWAHDPAFVDWLVALCNRERVDIILTGCEPVISTLARHREYIESETDAVCLVNNEAVMDICDDKLRTCDWLKAQGFAYPDYAAAENIDAVRCLADRCGFPLLAKLRGGGGAQGMLIINDIRDIAYIARKPGYVAQEYLGEDDAEYTVGCFCDRNGKLLGSIVLWRALLQGTTYRAVAGEYPDVRHEAERIAAALGPIGPCNIQLRMTERGPICFEINPRFSGAAPIRAHFGFNEVDAALRHFVLGEPAPALPNVVSGIALRYWNELYIPPEAVHALESNGRINNAAPGSARIDNYGIRES